MIPGVKGGQHMSRRIGAATALAAAAALVIAFAPSASAASAKCPSGGTPPPGSTIRGGLEVDGGRCFLNDVTVDGGITVDPSPELSGNGFNRALIFNESTVYGGVYVGERSGLRIDVLPPDLTLTPPSTINGGIAGDHPVFVEAALATINGGIKIDGYAPFASVFGCEGDPFCFADSPFCGNDIQGGVSIAGADATQVFIGDVGEQFYSNGDCSGNTIHGSVFLEDSNFIRFDGEPSEIEGNTVYGSVHLDHSTAEVNENTVLGSLLCSNGTVIHPGAPPDLQGNTVRGRDTCA
jgi:hypothetical protein